MTVCSFSCFRLLTSSANISTDICLGSERRRLTCWSSTTWPSWWVVGPSESLNFKICSVNEEEEGVCWCYLALRAAPTSGALLKRTCLWLMLITLLFLSLASLNIILWTQMIDLLSNYGQIASTSKRSASPPLVDSVAFRGPCSLVFQVGKSLTAQILLEADIQSWTTTCCS